MCMCGVVLTFSLSLSACVRACVGARAHVCVFIYMPTCVCPRVYASVYASVYAHMCMPACVCPRVYARGCMPAGVCPRVYAGIFLMCLYERKTTMGGSAAMIFFIINFFQNFTRQKYQKESPKGGKKEDRYEDDCGISEHLTKYCTLSLSPAAAVNHLDVVAAVAVLVAAVVVAVVVVVAAAVVFDFAIHLH